MNHFYMQKQEIANIQAIYFCFFFLRPRNSTPRLSGNWDASSENAESWTGSRHWPLDPQRKEPHHRPLKTRQRPCQTSWGRWSACSAPRPSARGLATWRPTWRRWSLTVLTLSDGWTINYVIWILEYSLTVDVRGGIKYDCVFIIFKSYFSKLWRQFLNHCSSQVLYY